MRGIGSEPVEVWLRDGRPARFVWRGRMHTILFVRDMRTSHEDSAAGNGVSQEIWLVEATPQRSVPASVYELCHDLQTDRWTLSRS
jgi:hypothetical protein